jgi:SAM-dependent methyltransferase
MSQLPQLNTIKDYYEERYHPEDMGPSRRSVHTFRPFMDWLGVQSNARLLDVACGAGALLSCAGESVRGVGIDLSEQVTQQAQQRVPHARFVIGDMQQLAFADASFDYVTNIGGLEHVPDMGQALREMARVCTSEGKLCLVVPNAHFFLYWLPGLTGTQQQEMLEHLLSFADWKALLEQAGLEILQVKADPGPNIRTDFGLRVWWRGLLRGFVLQFTRLLPLNLTYQFVFICRQR